MNKEKQYRPRLSEQRLKRLLQYEEENQSRVLVVADLHAPFILDGYLSFCKSVFDKYNCNRVVFIGDIIDNHYSSFHEADPDGDGAGKELQKAIEQIQEWYKVFPKADVLIGNHDAIPNRKAFSSGVSKLWIKKINEVLEVPEWNFHERLVIDGVVYVHGIGRKADARMYEEHESVVQGHYHSEGYLKYSVGAGHKFFAMQLGAGIDNNAYAFAYGKHFRKNHVNCGVVIGGIQPHLEYMDL